MAPKAKTYVPEEAMDLHESHREDGLAKKPRPKSMTKSVHWADYGIFFEITHINDMSEDEINDTWYSRSDYQSFRQDCYMTIDMATAAREAGKRLSGSKVFCERGLEHMIDEERSRLRRERVQEGVEVVLDEQEFQRNQRMDLPEIIAEMYNDISSQAHLDAHDVGLQYEKEMLRETLKEIRRAMKKASETVEIRTSHLARVGVCSPRRKVI